MMKYLSILLFVSALNICAFAENDVTLTEQLTEFEQQADSNQKSKTFYDYKHAGKQIDKIAKMLVADSVSFSYGIQSYRKFTINGTSSFYNQPSEMLYYLLLAEDNRAFHFEIPLADVAVVTIIEGSPKQLEIRMNPESSTFIKEYTARNGLLFSAGFSIVQIPISEDAPTRDLMKQFSILKKKAVKYQSAK